MIDTTQWNISYIGEKVIKPMYEDGTFPLSLADEIKNAIEKQIPKKVTGIKASMQNRYCPSCNEWMMFEKFGEVNYCPKCGQHLDWSVEE